MRRSAEILRTVPLRRDAMRIDAAVLKLRDGIFDLLVRHIFSVTSKRTRRLHEATRDGIAFDRITNQDAPKSRGAFAVGQRNDERAMQGCLEHDRRRLRRCDELQSRSYCNRNKKQCECPSGPFHAIIAFIERLS